MDPSVQNQIQAWQQEPFDSETRQEVLSLLHNDPKQLEDCFYTDLAFGTGGMRGLMGPGTNRMNKYTIRRATKGLASYLKEASPSNTLSVVIGFDSRNHSEEFAKEAAKVLIQSGIDVFLFNKLRPTPLISFACRHLKAQAGIMITASHNPKEYNGYKVYWDDGAQVVFPHDEGIMKKVHACNDFSMPCSKTPGTLHTINEEVDVAYLSTIQKEQTQEKQTKDFGKDLKIVYTSLHGTGITLMPKALTSWNFPSVLFVENQVTIDGSFPTVAVPNPESIKALELGLALLTKTSSDILLATDPDADRIGVAILHKNKPVVFTGNEIACICTEYLCQAKSLPNPAVITTIVSSDLISAICKSQGASCFEVLTGFKYIAEKIRLWENSAKAPSFLFGAEESYGYLYATHSRDKDAIIAGCLIAEIALYCKQKQKTLLDFLHEIYQKYGVFRERLISVEFAPGKAGIEELNTLISHLRKNPFVEICKTKVSAFIDYETDTDLPKSDVLLFRLVDGSKLVIRPSGTEPKLKIYAGVHLKTSENLEQTIIAADNKLTELLQALQQKLKPS